MENAYSKWRQTDPRFNKAEAWSAQQFPDAEFRFFRDAGCLVCALAVMLRHRGIEKDADEARFNPWILNEKLISCGAFTPAADLELSCVNRLYRLVYLGEIPYSRESLVQIVDKGLPCLVTVPGKNAEKHFLALLSLLPDDAVVYDPLSGEKLLGMYDWICGIRVFRPVEE